ncbi:hypothetical protein Bhyg_03365 [Pseudolycoriella hygida]|uniref:Uncharacterized protein n=1 Tax=Pseudolycoriella hygida TaxID=35572 RepID=A0A9Q0S9B5_9DIPT|nr:hypothetical protein Bhyg_03365 [Pseudolycoriella hygida]
MQHNSKIFIGVWNGNPENNYWNFLAETAHHCVLQNSTAGASDELGALINWDEIKCLQLAMPIIYRMEDFVSVTSKQREENVLALPYGYELNALTIKQRISAKFPFKLCRC